MARSWRGPRDDVCPTRIVSVPGSDCHIVLFGFHSKITLFGGEVHVNDTMHSMQYVYCKN